MDHGLLPLQLLHEHLQTTTEHDALLTILKTEFSSPKDEAVVSNEAERLFHFLRFRVAEH